MNGSADETPETFDILGVIERVSARQRWKRAAEIGAGTALLWLGSRRHSALGLVTAVLGATLALQGLTGKNLRALARSLPERLQRLARSERAFDMVDEASKESFPASDPPPY